MPSDQGRRDRAASSLEVPPVHGKKTRRAQRAVIKWMSHSRPGSFIALLNVWFLKSLPLISCLVVLRRVWRLSRQISRIKMSLGYAMGKQFLESWALLEFFFWVHFHCKKRSLEARRAYQPWVLHKEPGERGRLLNGFLEQVDQIYNGNLLERFQAEQPGSEVLSRFVAKKPSPRSHSKLEDEADTLIREADTLIRAPSVENFLRLQDSSAEHLVPLKQRQKLSISLPSLESLQKGSALSKSVGNLLQCEEADDGNQLLCLKHLELCSWFRYLQPRVEVCNNVNDIRRCNLEELVLSYWFDGAENREALTEEECRDLHELVQKVAQWACLPQPAAAAAWEGRNNNLQCFRLRTDPLPAVHRPLFTYAFTAFLLPVLGDRSLRGLGFRVFRAGSTQYWFRPASPSRDWLLDRLPHRPQPLSDSGFPLVFCHGIGVGPTMCLSFVEGLVKCMGGSHPIFLVDTAGISMRFTDENPCAREMAANMADMLLVWGLRTAHFVGHSFGTFLVAWVLRYQRSCVRCCTFLDPVCFMVLKMLADGTKIQQIQRDTRMDAMMMLVKYFVFTELYVCNFMCRCFFWEESQLLLEELVDIDTLVVLEAEDMIIPTHSVRRLVCAENDRRSRTAACQQYTSEDSTSVNEEAGTTSSSPAALKVFWIEDQPHAGILFDVDTGRFVCEKLLAFHENPQMG